MLPVVLRLTGRVVVVVGGGAVGRRKAAAAAAAGAAVTVVAPDPPPAGFADGVWRAERYHPDHLAGADLVFAAATPEVNAAVVRDARALRVWVCSASDPAAGDFALPAVARRGELTVAVATGGAAPAVARRVRDRLAAVLDDGYADWVAVLAQVRPAVLALPDPAARRALLERFAADEWLERVRADGPDAARAAMLEVVRGEPI